MSSWQFPSVKLYVSYGSKFKNNPHSSALNASLGCISSEGMEAHFSSRLLLFIIYTFGFPIVAVPCTFSKFGGASI
jgi:hypothetical protein